LLRALPIPPGSGALGIIEDLRGALDGTGPAVAPHAANDPMLPVPDARYDLDSLDDALPLGLAVAVGTSGSTGRPKLAMLTGSALRASTDATHHRLGGQGQWLLALPAHHIAGLQVLVRSLLSDTRPVCMEVAGGFTTAAFARATERMSSGSRAYTALVPTQLARLLGSPQGRKALTQFAAVLLGGAAAPPHLLTAASRSGIRVVTTYGMSETAGGCVYDGRALDVSRLRLEDDGRILLGGATLAEGYLGEPELTAECFTHGINGTAWFRTDDIGHLDHGALIVDGRIDDLINTGGLKVAPGLVEAALVELETIAGAVVVGRPDSEWGQVVCAAVVVAPGCSTPSLGELRDRLRGVLADHALPRRLVILSELPLRGPGKPDRSAIGQLFDQQE